MARLPGNITHRVEAPWGLARLRSDSLLPANAIRRVDRLGVETYHARFEYEYYTDACGQGVTIYILDDLIRSSHFQFKKISRVIYGADGKPTMQREDESARIEEPDSYNEGEHHGIAMAAIAAGLTYGVAPAADVVGIGYIMGDDLLAKMNGFQPPAVPDESLATMNGFQAPAVLNISNGIVPDKEMTRALVTLIKNGVHVVMAAGNSHIPLVLPHWDPSEVTAANGFAGNDMDHLNSIIWVGASTPQDKKWPWSAYGPKIDLFTPGEFIHSAKNDGDTSSLAQGGVMGGTSDAAPHVTGIIASLLSHPRYRNLPPRQMKDKIKAMAWQTAMDLTQAELNAGTTRRLASCHIDRWTLGD